MKKKKINRYRSCLIKYKVQCINFISHNVLNWTYLLKGIHVSNELLFLVLSFLSFDFNFFYY